VNAVSTAVDPLPPAVDDVLRRYWGFEALRPLQGSAIHAVLERRDSVVVLPTGGGKSLCFQVPALIGDDPGVALVVSPLIALMKDQVDGLVASGVPAARLDSTMSSDARQATFNGLRDGRFKLLYVSPERLMGDGGAGFQATMARTGVRYIAIDEAHCISHWGHDFRPEYRQLGALRAAWPQVSMHAFTATATTRVREDIVRQLGLRDALVLVGSFDRPNLIYRVRPRVSRDQQLEAVLTNHRGEAGIVYCISRKDVDQTAAALSDAGHKAVAYHAGLSDDERSRNQDAFIDERADVVVATVAFGMGIDRPDVRFVLHAGAPR
jgi:ATP-dependent DNA helicase RecQ